MTSMMMKTITTNNCKAFLKENLRKKLCFGDRYDGDEGEDSCSPWIYIPFPGTCGGKLGEPDARMEDNNVVEIRVGDNETLESILCDICNSKSPDGTDLASTVGIDGVPLSSTQPSSVQGERDEESTSEPEKTPEIQTLRQATRKAWYRRKLGNHPRLKDQELLYGKSVRPDYEFSRGCRSWVEGKMRRSLKRLKRSLIRRPSRERLEAREG